jgi:hypothetical protein
VTIKDVECISVNESEEHWNTGTFRDTTKDVEYISFNGLYKNSVIL